ncbi:acyltransferase family protein [Pedobacter soli]|uniref:Membrane-bound acyltransferase YfiQ, involved in biofilm formation n=1 Tax=Pedobacter soli TaxID=390242 RepID=A0A1G6UES9_9SPHI|nr:acyltransferase [Pedobacter soli]SDD39892.1 Membrane-bound acyltransferase YfiQ, involved in biofilm formation [Pedobacter soli]
MESKELGTATKKNNKNFNFIDGIRCIAMITIVMEHAISLDIYHPTDKLGILIVCAWTQLIKFGTICFFLLAGFLIGEKFMVYTPAEYMKRRMGTTIGPWFFWSVVFLLTMLANDLVKAVKFSGGDFGPNYAADFMEHLRAVYLFSNFWFIPNFLICIGILLLFRKYLYSNLFGAILLLLTLFYTVNIYFEWIEPRHSVALFGFIFFLWLGAQINKNLKQFDVFMNKVPYLLIIFLLLVFFVLGTKEELYLTTVKSTDPYNTLRITNIIYSLLCFALLYKIKEIKVISFLKPRETTFGVYLIHFILVASLLPMIFVSLKFSVATLSLGELVLYQFGRFVIVYILTYLIVMGINRTKASWLVGR